VSPVGHAGLQMPPTQLVVPPEGAVHALVQDPQVAVLVLSLTQTPLQSVPVVQIGMHAPPTQLVVPPVGATHAMPQVPQLAVLVLVLTQTPLQSVPVVQIGMHAPPTQLVLPPPEGATHAMPQPPQLAALVLVLTQTPLQSVSPVGQMGLQAPPTQLVVPPVGAVQVVPHAPQLAALVFVFTQAPLQSESPVGQTGLQIPPTQLVVPPPVGATHALPQVPQLLVFVLRVTHPLPLHCVCPAVVHAGDEHVPFVQVDVAPDTFVEHTSAHLPQLFESVFSLTHWSLQIESPAVLHTQVPFEHVAVAGHALPQAPQFAVSVVQWTSHPGTLELQGM